ncbi:hypothetical protein IEQ34_010977 [Dendrobium chrysotoxum]|uniref:Uncharacterized protein n=1 Tax=Dendrobium chrysotoxum TaxID=161865 RepID=A0AAV7GWZ3_DENCH|nr:hypothetical protein IEQ34_010977 [Dendrobium chrysotoxum]
MALNFSPAKLRGVPCDRCSAQPSAAPQCYNCNYSCHNLPAKQRVDSLNNRSMLASAAAEETLQCCVVSSFYSEKKLVVVLAAKQVSLVHAFLSVARFQPFFDRLKRRRTGRASFRSCRAWYMLLFLCRKTTLNTA